MESVSIELPVKAIADEKEQFKIIESIPKKVTTSLEIPADQTEKSMIARKQLENLTKKRNKKASDVTGSDNENTSIVVETVKEMEVVTAQPANPVQQQETFPEILYDGKPTMSNLSSAIISKEELEDEIRKKIAKSDTQQAVIKKSTSYDIGSIEIPQELILSEINTSASSKDNSQSSQLDEQQLIDILEGKDDQHDDVAQIIEVIGENGMFLVKDNKEEQTTSYEIISTEDEKMQSTKQKLLEREIAMRQIASMPTRKNRKLKVLSHPTTSTVSAQRQSLVQSLAMDWNDDDKGEEVILELENVEEGDEPKIKILNMTILNESSEEVKSLPVYKNEPKILNKNAPKNIVPKILNVNAPKLSTEEPKRVIKKKTIWDPSAASTSTSQSSTPPPVMIEKKPTPNKLPISLPSTITIKKLTKESLAKNAANIADQKEQQPQQTPGRKGKKKSEIDKLFQDEGAVNMIYSLERQNNNRDVPEIEVNVDQKSMIDKSEEKTKLMAKAKTIKQTIMKQSTSPPEAKITPARPQRIKRDLTPSKSESDSNSSEKKGTTPEKTEKTVIITKAQKTPVAGRKRKVDDSWDFVRKAQTTCDDAMIIRRHSNSSYSSSAPTSPRRLSLDADETGKFKEERNGFKFTKPQEKSPEIQKDLKSCVGGLVEELRNTLSTKLGKGKASTTTEKTPKGKKRTAAANNNNNNNSQESPPAKQRVSERRSNGTEKEFKIIKEDAITHIILTANPLTITLLGEIKTLLGHLETDESCKIVLITASDDFAHGLDYSTLVQNTIDKRKQAASDLVTAVK